MQEEALQIAAGEAKSLLKGEEGVTIFNSLSFRRDALVMLSAEYGDGAETMEGEKVPVRKQEDGVLALVSLPSCGSVSLRPLSHDDKDQKEALTKPEINMPQALV